MSRLSSKRENATIRQNRVRAKVVGTSERPRLCVRVSNTAVYAQIIDDSKGITLASSDSKALKAKGSLSEKAKAVGTDIAKRAKTKKVSKVALDRGEKQYHGRVKSLADAAREAGLEF